MEKPIMEKKTPAKAAVGLKETTVERLDSYRDHVQEVIGIRPARTQVIEQAIDLGVSQLETKLDK